MKYRKIYEALEKGGARICHEASGWRYSLTPYANRCLHPLWIIAEAKQQGLRIWISHLSGTFYIETANINLPGSSREYDESQQCYEFHSQKAVADFLNRLLQTDC